MGLALGRLDGLQGVHTNAIDRMERTRTDGRMDARSMLISSTRALVLRELASGCLTCLHRCGVACRTKPAAPTCKPYHN